MCSIPDFLLWNTVCAEAFTIDYELSCSVGTLDLWFTHLSCDLAEAMMYLFSYISTSHLRRWCDVNFHINPIIECKWKPTNQAYGLCFSVKLIPFSNRLNCDPVESVLYGPGSVGATGKVKLEELIRRCNRRIKSMTSFSKLLSIMLRVIKVNNLIKLKVRKQICLVNLWRNLICMLDHTIPTSQKCEPKIMLWLSIMIASVFLTPSTAD